MANKGAYISPAIKDPAIRDTLQSFADDIEAAGVTIANADPAAGTRARSGRLWYNATSSNLFIFSDSAGGWVPAANTGEEKSYHAVRIYWPNSTSPYPDSDPEVTLTWANLTQASTGARWKGGLALPTVNSTPWTEDPPNAISTGSTTIWWSDVVFQRTGDEATTTSTGTTPQKHTNFNGIVTFSNNSGSDIGTQVGLLNLFDAGDVQSAIANNVTSIDGGKITTNSIYANSIRANEISFDKITSGLNRITNLRGYSTSLVTLSSTTANHEMAIFPPKQQDINVLAIAVSHIYGTANSSSTATLNWRLESRGAIGSTPTVLATGTGSESTGSHLLGANTMSINQQVLSTQVPGFLGSSTVGAIYMVVEFSGVSGITNNPRVQTHFTMWGHMR